MGYKFPSRADDCGNEELIGSDRGKSSSARVAAIVLSIGVVAVMFATLSYKVFELDRYFVPKELVLNSRYLQQPPAVQASDAIRAAGRIAVSPLGPCETGSATMRTYALTSLTLGRFLRDRK